MTMKIGQRRRPGPIGPAAAGEHVPAPAPAGTPAPPRRAVRVTHVVGGLDRGGAETVSLDICRAVPPADVAQTFLTLTGAPGSLADRFRAAGAAVLPFPLRPVPGFVPRLWRHLRASRPDVVVSHVALTSALVLLVARAARVPVRVARIWSEGDGKADTPARRLRRAVARRLLRHAATDVVGVTAAALRFTRPPAGDPRYRVLYNSVDVARVDGWDRDTARRHWGLPPEGTVVAYLGRCAPEKNRPFVVDVHRELRRLLPETWLLVAGSGGVTDLTQARPEVVDDPSIVLAGEIDEIASVLAAADVLLLPSHREGLPGVVLEALAAGVPVVANDLPCLREVAALLPGITLVPLADGVHAWALAARAQAGTDAGRRREISRYLRSSPFLLGQAVRQWRSLWGADGR